MMEIGSQLLDMFVRLLTIYLTSNDKVQCISEEKLLCC